MLIKLTVCKENGRLSYREIAVKPNERYSDTLDIVDLLEEAIYDALASAGTFVEEEVTNE